jgi:hypothetical protein
MMNEFRRHPKVAGWLYTEHHDVINEWNGYWKYDRSMKYTGLEDIVNGMSLNDMHSYIYLAPGLDLCLDANAGEKIDIPVRLSIMTDQLPNEDVKLKMDLYGWNTLGEKVDISSEVLNLKLGPWEQRDIESISATMPEWPGLLIFSMQLIDKNENLLHSNFTTFKVDSRQEIAKHLIFEPASFTKAQWSEKQWNILDGLKVNGAGYGFFEYEVNIPESMDLSDFSSASLIVELSSKPLNGKDKEQTEKSDGNYMRGKGLHDPSQNPNSYPMTDEFLNPSTVKVIVNGNEVSEMELEDDPADHRGILSWHAQPRDRKLREAGTYGYLVEIPIDQATLKESISSGKLLIRFEVGEESRGGLAIYGKDFGRYPLDPTLIFK